MTYKAFCLIFYRLRDIAFWIGLTMTGSDRYTWVPDCVDLSPTYSYMFDSGVQGQRMCYTLDLPSGRATSRGCNATYPFLCQHKQGCISFLLNLPLIYYYNNILCFLFAPAQFKLCKIELQIYCLNISCAIITEMVAYSNAFRSASC